MSVSRRFLSRNTGQMETGMIKRERMASRLERVCLFHEESGMGARNKLKYPFQRGNPSMEG